ncbi:hypothetical protein C8R42DRAFT_638334 [Lentinula raphanica]|nr:hypothetical protein C8R42DRAFT_638334 [Lentinula raphanica]
MSAMLSYLVLISSSLSCHISFANSFNSSATAVKNVVKYLRRRRRRYTLTVDLTTISYMISCHVRYNQSAGVQANTAILQAVFVTFPIFPGPKSPVSRGPRLADDAGQVYQSYSDLTAAYEAYYAYKRSVQGREDVGFSSLRGDSPQIFSHDPAPSFPRPYFFWIIPDSLLFSSPVPPVSTISVFRKKTRGPRRRIVNLVGQSTHETVSASRFWFFLGVMVIHLNLLP